MNPVRTISKAAWKNYRRHGYASISNGERFILVLDKATGATVLERVEVV